MYRWSGGSLRFKIGLKKYCIILDCIVVAVSIIKILNKWYNTVEEKRYFL